LLASRAHSSWHLYIIKNEKKGKKGKKYNGKKGKNIMGMQAKKCVNRIFHLTQL
jgi:hypothetical protein